MEPIGSLLHIAECHVDEAIFSSVVAKLHESSNRLQPEHVFVATDRQAVERIGEWRRERSFDGAH